MDQMDLSQIKKMTHMRVPNIEGYLLVPFGVVTKFAHENGKLWSVYVENWTSAKEFDDNRFYLHPILLENQQIISVNHHEGGGPEVQLWYTLGEPTRRATKVHDHFEEQVSLRQSDGTEVRFRAMLPLPQTIKEGDESHGELATKRYCRTEQMDDECRIVYVED
jgi:hypothetical protein